MSSRSLVLFLLLPIFLAIPTPTLAARNITITCTNSSCDFDDHTPLFNETNWVPESSEKSVITVQNNRSNSCDLVINVNPEAAEEEQEFFVDFYSQFFTSLEQPVGISFYLGTINSMFLDGNISLGTILESSSKDYTWTITFKPSAGNEYQSSTAVFDATLKFECIESSTNSNGGGDDDDDGDDDGSGTTISFTNFFPQVGGIFFQNTGQSEGVGTTEPQGKATPLIEGVSDEFSDVLGENDLCVDVWYWWLVFVVQLVVHAILLRDKKRFFYLQLGVAILFFYIFWKYFCPWWDMWVSLSMAAIFVTIQFRKSRLLGNNRTFRSK